MLNLQIYNVLTRGTRARCRNRHIFLADMSNSNGSKDSKATADSTRKSVPEHSNLAHLVRTTEFSWFICHVIVLSAACFNLLTGRQFWYRLVFVASAGAFGIVLKQKWASRTIQSRPIVLEETVHYLSLSLLWLLTRKVWLAIVPFTIISIFHGLTYVRTYLLPTLGYSPTSTIYLRVDHFIKTRNEQLTIATSMVELQLLVVVVLNAILFRRGSFLQLIGYSIFMRLRYATSQYTRSVVDVAEVKVDGLLSHPSLPPFLKQYWIKIKQTIAYIPIPGVNVRKTE